jgi:23S rRNA (guanosine2251-2'-O)-methyltransferase
MFVYGLNPVFEALRAGRVTAIRVGRRDDGRLRQVLELARERGVPVERVESSALDRLARGGLHQGVVAEVGRRDYAVGDLVTSDRPVLIVVLDGIEDSHNVGAIARTVDAAGADGIIRQTRRAAPLDAAAAKASSGALAHVKVASVVNIARALEELKAQGVWTAGLAADASRRYDQVDLTVPLALVVGSEGTGLRRLVRDRCDFLVRIPMMGQVDSLNVSVAAGVVLFEALRQRGWGVPPGTLKTVK